MEKKIERTDSKLPKEGEDILIAQDKISDAYFEIRYIERMHLFEKEYNNIMRDLMLIMPTSPADWNLDFDFINGVPRMVPDLQNTQDQRAAISAYTLKGTIPGKKEEGIGWSQLYDKENTIYSHWSLGDGVLFL